MTVDRIQSFIKVKSLKTAAVIECSSVNGLNAARDRYRLNSLIFAECGISDISDRNSVDMRGDDDLGRGAYVLCDSDGILIRAAVLEVACGICAGKIAVDRGNCHGRGRINELDSNNVVAVHSHDVIFKRELLCRCRK